ncbi:MAG TPA: c-type cytochrome [Anaerolineales bacterium]|nr:c-type cytochrome [Anaerolineales bacterium]
MNEKEKKDYLEKYKKEKENGVPFFPDIIFKDAVVSFFVFLILIALAYFVGIPAEERANPNDTSYTPRPEWYFLFLFQLLKYFPGNLEVIGAMILPGLFVLLLLLLPFIDKSPKRHFRNRPIASIAAVVVVLGIGALTVAAVLEVPPPQEEVVVDRAAALYAANCANCHGESIDVQPGTDLHQIIAAGTHEGMPAWGGDLSTDEIDQLAGFILSPNGSIIYSQQCETCHTQMVQAAGNPLELQRVFTEGANYPGHEGVDIPDWNDVISEAEKNALLNFLAAPDGQRLFVINCAGCHGQGVAFAGTEEELYGLISNGGQHLEMPAWKGTLTENDLAALAAYVVDPGSYPAGETLFGQHCAACHSDRVPIAPDRDSAVKIISSGGPHIDMPIWGNILTDEQLDALVQYTFEASRGGGAGIGGALYTEHCSACHGAFGEGGPNPALPGDIILPISTAEYLKTRTDETLRNIISQGQPNIGMSPFGDENGGPLDGDQIDAIVAFMRGWEANPPVEELPEYPVSGGGSTTSGGSGFSGQIQPILEARCVVCHNANKTEGGWDGTSYEKVMSSGDNAPVIIPGDVENSLLAQYLLGTNGDFMPPIGSMPEDEIQAILDWIAAGAENN